MSVLGNNLLLGGQKRLLDIANSIYLDSASSSNLTRTFGIPTDDTKWTFSTWVKKTSLGTGNMLGAGSQNNIGWSTDRCYLNFGNGLQLYGNQFMRDTTAWYHVVVVHDTNNATTTLKARYYINGVEVTDWNIDQRSLMSGASAGFNKNGQSHQIGSFNSGGYLDGYLAQTAFIDGQVLDPTSFGEFDNRGVWRPIDLSGLSFGNNGFLLAYEDALDLGADTSGNNNSFTANNIASGNQSADSPTKNHCVMNDLDRMSTVTLSEAGLKVSSTASGNNDVRGTISRNSGKWYFEFTPNAYPAGNAYPYIGWERQNTAIAGGNLLANGLCWAPGDGTMVVFGTNTPASPGFTEVVSNVCRVAIDFDAGKIWFGNQTGWYNSGNPAAGTNPSNTWSADGRDYAPAFSGQNATCTVTFNFGQNAYFHTPPTGFKDLRANTSPKPAFADAKDLFDLVGYTGNNLAQTLTGLQFSPDLVWAKNRGAAQNWFICDSVRGANKYIDSDTTAVEVSTGGVTSFDANGFKIPVGMSDNAAAYIAWCFKQNSGFLDIVSYTGDGVARNISHSLGKIPDLIIVKNRDSAQQWAVYHSKSASDPETDLFHLDAGNVSIDDATVWDDTAPSASDFRVGTSQKVNGSTNKLIAYLFSNMEGVCKVGTYRSNGSADGPFVWCGFKPKWILLHNTDVTSEWIQMDTLRSPINPINEELSLSTNGAEIVNASSRDIDLTANGFKVKGVYAGTNSGSNDIIFMAFADEPFGGSGLAPSVAK